MQITHINGGLHILPDSDIEDEFLMNLFELFEVSKVTNISFQTSPHPAPLVVDNLPQSNNN